MFNAISSAVTVIFVPLSEAVTDPRKLEVLLARAGHETPELDSAAVADFLAGLGLADEFEAITSFEPTTDLVQNLALLDSVRSAWNAIEDRISGETAFTFGPTFAEWADPGQVLRDVIDMLVAAWVDTSSRGLNIALTATGVRRQTGPGPIYWSDLPRLLTEGRELLVESWGWGSDFNVNQLDTALAAIGDLLPVPIRRQTPRDTLAAAHWPEGIPPGVTEYVLELASISSGLDASFGLVLMPVGDAPGDPVTGLLIAPLATAGIAPPFELAPGWVLTLGADADLTGVVGMKVLPTPPDDAGGLPGLALTPTSGAPAFEFSAGITGSPPPGTTWEIGGETGPSLQLRGLGGSVSVAIVGGQPEIEVGLWLRTEAGEPGLVLSLHDPEADGFMSWVLSDNAGADLDLAVFISQRGVRLEGGLGLALSIPIDRAFGPLYLQRIDLAVAAELDPNPALSVAATATGNVTLGPLVLVAEGLGVAIVFEAAPEGDGLLGKTDMRFEFIPPTAFGASIDAGVVTGGGFVEVSPPRYSGILDLDIAGTFGITVIAVVEAAGADASPGTPNFSMFLSVVTEFTPIPLAFGFTLNGVGGIVCFNRGINTDALVDGLFSGTLDHVLYPEDPIANAPAILDSIDAFFPIQDGAVTFGPIVKIGWGVPVTLVEIDLGILITFPDVIIVLLGKVSIAIPTAEAPLIKLNAQLLGIIDFAGPTILVLASITDSEIIGIRLRGDMAVYLDLGSQPYFFFSVGGTHPDWVPPAGLPAPLTDLERLSASIEFADWVSIQVWGYFALTSNSVHFGGGINLEASTRFLGTTYYARGWFETHVLLIFNPFRINASLSAGVEIGTDRRVLLGVMFEVNLQGPDPWFVTGGAEFRFFGIKVSFPIEIGNRQPDELRPAVDVASALRDALIHEDSWRSLVVSASDPIRWVAAPDTTRQPLRPQDAIEVTQTVVPLGVQIEKFGTGQPDGPDRFDIGGVTLDGATTPHDVANDLFAPAVFFEMSRSEKLAAPSFESHAAGVTFGDAVVVDVEAASVVSIDLDQQIVRQPAVAAGIRTPLSTQRLPGGASSNHRPVGAVPGDGTRIRTTALSRTGSS